MVLLYTTYQTISSVQILKKPLKFVDVTINHDQRLSLTRTAFKTFTCGTLSPFHLWMIFVCLTLTTLKCQMSVILQNILFLPWTVHYFLMLFT